MPSTQEITDHLALVNHLYAEFVKVAKTLTTDENGNIIRIHSDDEMICAAVAYANALRWFEVHHVPLIISAGIHELRVVQLSE